jgi:hypothetical protein
LKPCCPYPDFLELTFDADLAAKADAIGHTRVTSTCYRRQEPHATIGQVDPNTSMLTSLRSLTMNASSCGRNLCFDAGASAGTRRERNAKAVYAAHSRDSRNEGCQLLPLPVLWTGFMGRTSVMNGFLNVSRRYFCLEPRSPSGPLFETVQTWRASSCQRSGGGHECEGAVLLLPEDSFFCSRSGKEVCDVPSEKV